MASRLCILEVRGPHLAPQTQPCKNLIGNGMAEAELRKMMERRIWFRSGKYDVGQKGTTALQRVNDE